MIANESRYGIREWKNWDLWAIDRAITTMVLRQIWGTDTMWNVEQKLRRRIKNGEETQSKNKKVTITNIVISRIHDVNPIEFAVYSN